MSAVIAAFRAGFGFGVLIGLTLMMPSAWARQDPEAVRLVVEDFLRIQTQGLPGRVSIEVRSFEANNALPACSALEAFLPNGARAWGRTAVGVRCIVGANWSAFVQAQVRVTGAYLVTARALAQGQVLGAADVALQSGDLTDQPPGILTDPAQAVGRSLVMSLAAGRPVRSDVLKQPAVVQQGQGVKVIARGEGFSAATEGRALNSAAEGQVTQVRLSNGQVLSGVARVGGVVEIRF